MINSAIDSIVMFFFMGAKVRRLFGLYKFFLILFYLGCFEGLLRLVSGGGGCGISDGKRHGVVGGNS